MILSSGAVIPSSGSKILDSYAEILSLGTVILSSDAEILSSAVDIMTALRTKVVNKLSIHAVCEVPCPVPNP